MATYAQWSRSDRKLRRLTWVCGPEDVLVEEVVSAARAAVPGVYVPLSAAVVPEQEVWDTCSQFPPPGHGRLVVVRDAEALTRWDALEDLAALGREFTGAHLVLVSGEPDYVRRAAGGRELLPGPAWVQATTKGQIVKCVLSPDDKAAWVRERLPGHDGLLAWHILDRAGHDLAAARDVCAALEVLDVRPTEAAVDALCAAHSRDLFEDALVSGNRPAALLVVPEPGDLGRVIGTLAARLTTLAALYRAWQQELGPRDIVGRLGVPQLLVAKFRTAAKDYPPERVRRLRRLLAELDGVYRSGEHEAVAEALVALW